MEDVKVSVLCLTYNHKKYIRKALEGFVAQKTNFRFEVLIHDDASTDGTECIVKEYEELYPELIRGIYQTENQYSKGVKVSSTWLYPIAKGKYFALCEGDDYWTDPYKLQKQYDYMAMNEKCAICVHQAISHDCSRDIDTLMTKQDMDKDYSVEDVILGGGNLFATNSVFMKREIAENRPQCFDAKEFGDYQCFMFGAISGGCHYIAEAMSVYNCGTEGSWTLRVEKNTEKRIQHYKEMIRMLNAVDKYYTNKFSDAIKIKICETEYKMLKAQGKMFDIIKPQYKKYYKQDKYNGISPIKECIAMRFPELRRLTKKIRKNDQSQE